MRKRMLSPGFFENPDLAELDPHTRLLFAGLWLLADREGRLGDDARRIRGAVFPYESGLDVDAMLEQLAGAGFVVRYEADGQNVIGIPRFLDHQKPHERETASRLPAYDTRSTEGAPKANLDAAKVAGVVTVSVSSGDGLNGDGVVTESSAPKTRSFKNDGSDTAGTIAYFEQKIGRDAKPDEIASIKRWVTRYGKGATDYAIGQAAVQGEAGNCELICTIAKAQVLGGKR